MVISGQDLYTYILHGRRNWGRRGTASMLAIHSHTPIEQKQEYLIYLIHIYCSAPEILEPSAVPALCLELKLRNLPGRSLWLH